LSTGRDKEMAKVASALEEKNTFVAGTGTGKTAYLVPAILSGKRIVISTAPRTSRNNFSTRTCRFSPGTSTTRCASAT
jgi:ATP-dependent DNA helicase DinG